MKPYGTIARNAPEVANDELFIRDSPVRKGTRTQNKALNHTAKAVKRALKKRDRSLNKINNYYHEHQRD